MDILNVLSNLVEQVNTSKINRTIGGATKDETDKLKQLIQQYDDANESIAGYNDVIEESSNTIKQLDKEISDLTKQLGKYKSTKKKQETQDKIDKKKKERDETITIRNSAIKGKNREETRKSLTGARFGKVTGGKDIEAVSKDVGAISKGGISKFMKGTGGAVISLLVQTVEFGIGKATDYIKLNYENLLRALNASTTVTVNSMKANIASWQDSVTGAYEAQNMAISNQEAILEAQNATELATMKLTHTWTNWIPIWGQINKYQETVLEMEQQLGQTRLDSAYKIITQVNDFTRRSDDYIRKQEKSMRMFQIDRGMSTSQYNKFQDIMLSQGETFAKFNKTIEDVLKLQSTYTEQSGRAINFSENDNMQTLAVGRLVGDENLVNFQSQMQLFNHSVSESADIMYEMYKDVNKMGLSQKKVTKDVLANLKLANKYDFKNGTKGFIELAKWAENARFNLSSLGNIIEKTQSGGLEGVITQSAKLQVLGGNFARYADPLAMFNESLTDPEAYSKRILNMFTGMGNLDRKTGETEFNGNDHIRIRAAAEALGISVEDAKNMIREDNKKSVVKSQMRSSTLSKKQQDAVANKAQRDEKTGRWYVNTINGDKIDVSDDQKLKANLDNIVSDNKDEAAVQYAQNTLSFVEKIEATTKQIDAKLGALTFANFAQMSEEQMKITLNGYSKYSSDIQKAIEENRLDSTVELKAMMDALAGIDAKYEKERNIVEMFKNEKPEDANYVAWRESENRAGNTHAAYDKASEKFMQAKKEYDASSGVNAIIKWYNKQEARAAVNRAQYVDNWKNADGFWDKVGSVFKSMISNVTDDETIQKQYELRKKYQDSILESNGESETFPTNKETSVHDGIISFMTGNTSDKGVSPNKPITLAANKVTPIHDGAASFAKSDPKDSAIFAKVGGPFDTLFNGIFDKINQIYADTKGGRTILNNYNSNVVPIEPIGKSQFVSSDYGEPTVKEDVSVQQLYDKIGSNTTPQEISMKPVEVRLSGSVRLEASGQSVDLMDMLNKNPMLIRQLSQMISDEVGKSINGGRGVTQYDYLRK